jgi:hypothetical protein
VRSSRPWVVVGLVFLALVAGCSEKTSGAPSPGGSTTDEPASSESSTESSGEEPSSGGGTADLKPCAVLDQADLAALQLTGGEEKELAGARVCRYRHEGATLNETFTVSVELFDDRSLAELNAPDITPLPPVGGHEAVKFTNATRTCGVSLAVGESRVDNTAVGGDQQLGCQFATQLATAVAPKLPEG